MAIGFYIIGFGILFLSAVRIHAYFTSKISTTIKSRKKIAEGGQGSIFKITHYNGEIYAEKLINIRHFDDNQRARLKLELQFFSTLNHPTLMKYLRFTFLEDKLSIMMEFSFSSLRHFLQRESLAKSRVLLFALDVAKAILYLHENNLIHRDIKSENVLLFQTEERLVAKLADFGFLLFPQHEQTVCGTIGFMAPEMLQHKKYGPEIDIFAFGMLLYEMISGQIPYALYSKVEINQFIRNGQLPIFTNETEQLFGIVLVNLVKSCWQQNPKKRPLITNIIEILQDQIKQ